MLNSTTSLASEYLDSLKKYPWIEGKVNHMYLDGNGYVTVGRGHLISTVQEAKKLQFIHDSGIGADQETIAIAYEWVKTQKKGQYPQAYKNLKYNNIILSQLQIDVLAQKDINDKIDILRSKFPGFDAYPLSVQMALLDHWFNVGNASKFVNMIQAVKDKNWSKAAFCSHIKTTADGVYPRVILKTVRFCQAAQDAGQQIPGSFCYYFQEKIQAEGFGSYEDLLNALSKYQSTYSKRENMQLLQKLKNIDRAFKTYSE